MSSKLALDIGDLNKQNPPKNLLWTLSQGSDGCWTKTMFLSKAAIKGQMYFSGEKSYTVRH